MINKLPVPEAISDPAEPKADQPTRSPSGYLVVRLRHGQGLQLGPDAEVWVSKQQGDSVQLAVRAPRSVKIRKLE